MAQDARWLNAADRLTEGDAQAAGTVGSHGQSSIGEGQVCRPCRLEKAEWPGKSGSRHVGEGCSYFPGSESDGKLAIAYLNRRGGRGDTEGQAGQPVRSSEQEREGLLRHCMELPNNVRIKHAVAAYSVLQEPSIPIDAPARLYCETVSRSSECGTTRRHQHHVVDLQRRYLYLRNESPINQQCGRP